MEESMEAPTIPKRGIIHRFKNTLSPRTAAQAQTTLWGKPTLFKNWTATVSTPKKKIPGRSQIKDPTAKVKLRP